MVGRFALGLAVTTPVIMFANLQLRAVQATDARRDYAFGEYFGLRIITTLLALITILMIALIGYRNETVLIILLIGVAKSFESLSDVVYGFIQQRERMDRIAHAKIIKGPASLVALAIGVIVTGGVPGGVIGMIVVWAALFFLYDLRNARALLESRFDLRPRWPLLRLVKLAWLALPLGLVMMLISLTTSIPRIFVERYLGEAQLGIFAAMAYMIVAGKTVVGALGQSASPRLATYYATGQHRAYFRLLGKLVLIGAGLGTGGVIVALLAGEQILGLLYGPEYAANAHIFVWIMLAAGIANVSSFLGYAATSARVFTAQVFVSSSSVLIALIASLILIPTGSLLYASFVLLVVSSTNLGLFGMLVYVKVLKSDYHGLEMES